MANNDDTLLREVEEELRRERMEQLWNRYGNIVLAAAAALVLMVGGYKFYEARQLAAANAAGSAFEKAAFLATEKKTEEARKAFEDLAKTAPGGYAALARLRLAGLALDTGDKAKAAAEYEALTSSSGTDPLLKSFAKLQATALKIGEADFTEVENRLNDLVGETSPWRANAREMLALAALKAGKTEVARKALEELLADRAVPGDIRERAQMMLSGIVAADLAKASQAGAAAPNAADVANPVAPPAAEKK